MKTKMGLEELYNEISKMFSDNEIDLNDGIVITNIRHKNQIHKAIERINRYNRTKRVQFTYRYYGNRNKRSA